MRHSVIQIVPRLPPAVCGIGDYAIKLARGLRDDHEMDTEFVVAGFEKTPAVVGDEFAVRRVPAGIVDSLRRAVVGEAKAIILHVSTYGYQKRGVPLWLAQALSTRTRLPLVAMFHELYAGGSPRTSAFWLQPLQKLILRRIVRGACRLRTNRSGYAEWLNAVNGRKAPPATVMPVFSNLGELKRPPPLADRPDGMVMFASGVHSGGNSPNAVLRGVALCGKLGLRSLHVFGFDAPAESRDGVTIRYRKYLPVAQATDLLAQCRAAFTIYSPNHLAKSGVFAAYAAHGMAVVVGTDEVTLPDGLRHGAEYLREASILSGQITGAAPFQAAADGIHLWYGGHTVTETAASFANDVRSVIARRTS